MEDEQANFEEEIIETNESSEEIENEEQESSEPVEEETKVEESSFEEIPEEPQVRKSAKDFIIERKNRQIEKLKEQANYYDEDDSDEDDPRSVIRKEVREALEPITNVFKQQEDEREIQDALSKYPEAKKIEASVRKFASSPAYSQVPIEFIVRGLLGAKANVEAKKQEADDIAKRSRNGGSSRRPKEIKEKTAWDMTDAEFEKEISKAMQR